MLANAIEQQAYLARATALAPLREPRAQMQAEDAYPESLQDDFEERVPSALRAVPRVMRDRQTAEKSGGVSRARAPVRQIRQVRHPFHDSGVGRFLQHDDIRRAGTNHRRDGLLTPGATVADVVAEEPKRHARASWADSSCVFSSASMSLMYG